MRLALGAFVLVNRHVSNLTPIEITDIGLYEPVEDAAKEWQRRERREQEQEQEQGPEQAAVMFSFADKGCEGGAKANDC